MTLPTFTIGGAQKSGTTTLHHYLRAHPNFIPKRPRELHFFDLDHNYARGVNWYADHFTPATPAHRAIGQTSPLYLRNPVNRAYSHYWHEIKNGRETLDFETALAVEERRIASGHDARRAFSDVDRGRYAVQPQRYLRYFRREQVFVRRMEDLARDTERTLDECAHFLAVQARGRAILDAIPARASNASRLRSVRAQRLFAPWRSGPGILTHLVDRLNLRRAAYPPMAEHVRRRLALEFRDDVARLEQLTGMSFESWSGRATRTVQ